MNEKKTSNAPSSRRQFLQASTAAAVGAGLMFNDRIARSAHGAAARDGALRVGLVGCGGRGRGAAVHALTADPNARLVALADAFADYVEQSVEILKKTEVADRVSVDPEHRFSGFDASQQLIQSDVDVVLLATPPHFRPAHLKACVDAGKHVFAEKPVAVDAPGIRAVLAACEEARKKNLSIVSGLMYRYDHAMQETIKRIHDGAIGDIVAVQTTYNVGPPWFRNKDRQPDWTEMEYQMRNWYPFTWLGTKGRCDLMKYRIEGETNWRYEGAKPNGFIAEHEALFTSIRAGRPVNNGLYMAHSTLWAILGRMATYTGKTITWEQAMNSNEDLSPERYAWDAQPPLLPDENGNYPIALPGVTKFV